MSLQSHLPVFCMATALILVSGELTANSSDEDQSVVNYSYAAYFGTGAYQVRDQKAYVIRAPLSYGVREPSPEQPGIRIRLPTGVNSHYKLPRRGE